MKKMIIDKFTENDKKNIYSDFSENNEYITETAGFVPLDVKLRRFQENGQIMQFHTSEFTSGDYRDFYLSPDLEITPEMDLEEIQEVQLKRSQFVENLIKEKSKTLETSSPKSPPAGSQTEEIVEKE